jgi:hypothetical protein
MNRIILIFSIIIIAMSQSVRAEQMLLWTTTTASGGSSGTTYNGLSYSCAAGPGDKFISSDIFSYDTETGTNTLLKSFDQNNPNCNLNVANTTKVEGGSFYDILSGYFYAQQSNGNYKILDINNNFSELDTYVEPSNEIANQSHSVTGRYKLGSNMIVGADGKKIIEKTNDGAIHIGENSLVTIETGGRQDLYATDEAGNQIDINIKSGTNLLIDGTNITSLVGSNTSAISTLQQDLSGSVALSSALAALPNSSPDAFYTCGLGTGIHDSSSALSAGCASDFSNYAFVDIMPKIFQSASLNIGSSFLMNGEPDLSEVRDMSIKAGITFKFGSVKPTRVADRNNHMLENKIDAVMQENRTLKAQLKEENDSIRQENELLKAQIAEINSQLKALNMLAMN